MFHKYCLSKFHTVAKCALRGYCRSIAMETPLNLSTNERLCPSVRPVHYKLLLQPDTATGLFKGNVIIDVSVNQEKNSLYFHSKSLQIDKVNVSKNKSTVPISKLIEVQQLEQLSIHFDDAIGAGDYQIEIVFRGDLTHKIVGLYLSNLKDNRTMVASKFQPTYARQAFPCFDEPDFKATYEISLLKPPSYVALSNMNELSRSLDKNTNMETVNFATSVPMSTYLACFVICDFESKETVVNSKGIGNNFKLRSFAQKDQLHKIDFAQDIGKRATEFYINYYKVPFPLPKLDMIAIPDYVSGATEHWGLVTYRETSFLVDESTASAQNKISVANTIAHELAHMWFGNLVTMKWWDEVWLNEGFASYMQVKALNAIEPSWTMLDQFLIKTLHSVLVTDAKLSSHPIVQTVATPDQITAIFDAISYNKGSSILRMLEGFIGEENFQQGVSDYLKKYEFGNTVTQDLLSCLEPYFAPKNPHRNLTYIMDTWTRQMGYPVLNVARGEEANTFIITQKRFLLDPGAVYADDSPFNYRWSVPITYKTDKGVKHDVVWFPDTSANVKIQLEDKPKWLKINNNQIGYYRVNYTADMWHKLIEQLNNKNDQLTISDRSHLLDDIFALAEAKMVPYDLALDLTTYLIKEEDYVPWETATSIFTKLLDRVRNNPAYDKLKKYMQHLVRPLYVKQSWEWNKASVIDSLLRSRILSLAAKSGLPDAKTRTQSIFLGWLESQSTSSATALEPDLRTLVYNMGMESASEEVWDKLWAIYLKEEDAQEQAKLRRALAAPKDTSVLKKYLSLAWDESNIRSQDFLNVLQHISVNPYGTQIVWDDVRARWPQLVERFTLNSRYLGNMVSGITSTFNTELKLKEIEEWFEKYPEAGAGASARSRALETVRNNIKWAQTHHSTVSSWLESKQL